MSEFSTEQLAALEAREQRIRDELDAKYSKGAHAFRDWITAHPLPAARVIGFVCLVSGFALGVKLGPVVGRLFS